MQTWNLRAVVEESEELAESIWAFLCLNDNSKKEYKDEPVVMKYFFIK